MQYSIPDFAQKKPFSSFLPGIAGQYGIPLWVFYVNRGQAITSFGVQSKDVPIMEFLPANKAYQRTEFEGFRTFLKWKKENQNGFYEPFSTLNKGAASHQNMSISPGELSLTDENPTLGLRTEVTYFTIPEESFAALARQVTITNTSTSAITLEALDGMPILIPFGVDNGGLKTIGRTIEAWMQVLHLESGLPFFCLKATLQDTSEVHELQAGHFALGFSSTANQFAQGVTIVDPVMVFGENTSLSIPNNFLRSALEQTIHQEQITVGKTPCAFFGHQANLPPQASVSLYSLFGHVNGYENIAREKERIASPEYFSRKKIENREIIQHLTSAVTTKTANPLFDAYAQQTYLDNVLRGGVPIFLANHPYHIFSRKHGDPERDYNHFFLATEFFSQGNGNFRDICQNRRSEILIEPGLRDHNIRTFLSLIQLDGYNPLVIRGTSFSIAPAIKSRILDLIDSEQKQLPLLDEKFTPGALLTYIADHEIKLTVSYDEFIKSVFEIAESHLDADFGEGFWIDHWTYILDLIENFLAVYPDRKEELLQSKIPFFSSPAQVRPRAERYVQTQRGIRQYNAVAHHTTNGGWVHTSTGEKYHTTILGKLILLATTKFGTLDPDMMGIEMEAGKPGWYDALNGLPGIFGSSMNETYELLRLIRFLTHAIDQALQISLPLEFAEYLKNLTHISGLKISHFSWWEQANALREAYRQSIYQPTITGEEAFISGKEIIDTLQLFAKRLENGISRARQMAVVPTYFSHEVTDHEIIKDEQGEQESIRVNGFRSHVLPPFLEGAVRAMKIMDIGQVRELHTAVKSSDLYDKKLKMYKVNAPLSSETHEIGRARAFTPGWLENESVWLHMEYKYLLQLLKAGLYDEFFEDLKNCLIPFQPAERYGRSPLENSSFLASSAHPDKSIHGNGFVARLSGATAEFIGMWTIMMIGKSPFKMEKDELTAHISPVLPHWLFDNTQQITFNFLGGIPVTYYNPKRIDTWKVLSQKITIHLDNEEQHEFIGATVPAPFAELIRERKVRSIFVHF